MKMYSSFCTLYVKSNLLNYFSLSLPPVLHLVYSFRLLPILAGGAKLRNRWLGWTVVFNVYILIVAEVRVHYSWDCIRRLLDAREAGRKVEAGGRAQHASTDHGFVGLVPACHAQTLWNGAI